MRTAKEIIKERYWYRDCNNSREINLDDLAEIIRQARAEMQAEAAKIVENAGWERMAKLIRQIPNE